MSVNMNIENRAVSLGQPTAKSKSVPPVEANFHQALEGVDSDRQTIQDSTEDKRQRYARDLVKQHPEVLEQDYIQEHVSGVAYIDQYKLATEENAYPVLTLFALQGAANQLHYEPHELTIVSEKVAAQVSEYIESLQTNDSLILVRYKMVNPGSRPFFYQDGEEIKISSVITGTLTAIALLQMSSYVGSGVSEEEDTDDSQESPDFVFQRS